MFGGEIDAVLIGGIVKLDANRHHRCLRQHDAGRPARLLHRRPGRFQHRRRSAGFTIRIGLSELGPLDVVPLRRCPVAILLEPNTGLSINDFTAGVEFFKTLPSIDDP